MSGNLYVIYYQGYDNEKKTTSVIYDYGENKSTKKQRDTTKKGTTSKHQVTGKLQTDNGGNILEEMPVKSTWYRFTELRDKKWMEFEKGKMPSREPSLETFSAKFQNQAPWKEDELKNTSEERKVGKVEQDALKSGI